MVYFGTLDFEDDWDFKVEVNKLIPSENKIQFELTVKWSQMGNFNCNGTAQLSDRGFFESSLEDCNINIKAKIIFTYVAPDFQYKDLLNVRGYWFEYGEEEIAFDSYLESK